MKRPARGSTVKQFAYAQNKLNGRGSTKKEVALLSGFSPSVARNARTKIESTEGYHNAMLELATKSNNLILAAFSEYQARGLKDFTNKDLNGALNAITGAWERIEKLRSPNRNTDPNQNPLRKVFMQRVENQTVNITEPTEKQEKAKVIEAVEIKPKKEKALDLDF